MLVFARGQSLALCLLCICSPVHFVYTICMPMTLRFFSSQAQIPLELSNAILIVSYTTFSVCTIDFSNLPFLNLTHFLKSHLPLFITPILINSIYQFYPVTHSRNLGVIFAFLLLRFI